MKRSIILITMLLSCLTASAESQKTEQLGILGQTDGFIHPAAIPFGHGWLALIEKAGSWKLVPTNIRLVKRANPNSQNEWEVDLYSSDQPQAGYLLRHSLLSPHKVTVIEAWPPPKWSILPFHEEKLSISFAGREYTLLGEAQWSDKATNPRGRYKVFLRAGKTITLLYEWDIGANDPVASLRWAGDLDGDGLLDLIIEFSTYTTSQNCLFLSRPADHGKLVKRVGCDFSSA